MPNFKSVVHFHWVDFGGGCSACCSSSYDRCRTKSTPSVTRLRLDFDNDYQAYRIALARQDMEKPSDRDEKLCLNFAQKCVKNPKKINLHFLKIASHMV